MREELILEKWARKRLFFRLEHMENVWLELLKTALNALVNRTDAPVSGAKLRAAVKKQAEDRGLPFPPEGMTKWSAFLGSFPNEITLVPNRGSDVLVVPADRPDLQAAAIATASAVAPQRATTRLRSDLFEALTRIPLAEEKVLYLPESDAVLWQRATEAAPSNAVPVPSTTLDAEVALRREFADQSEEVTDAAKTELLAALDTEGALRNFSQATRAFGLVQHWHNFRLRALTKKLRDWAVAHGLQFREEWLGADQPTPHVDGLTTSVTGGSKRGLVELAGMLSEDDIARISVPLDIVLRLLANR